MRTDLPEIIESAWELGICTSMVTNASLLTPVRIPALKAARLDCLLVSLDSTCSEIHDDHRGIMGLYAHVMRCLEWIDNEFVNQHRVGGLMWALTRCNLAEIDDVLSLAERLGVYVLVQPYHPNKTGEKSSMPLITTDTVQQLLRAKNAGKPLLSSRRYLHKLPRFWGGSGMPPCSAGQKYFSVDPYGYLHPCVERPASRHILRDNIDVIRSAAVLDSVAQCPGCWYCFRGEADSTLSVAGYLEKLRQAVAVVRRNRRRLASAA